MEKKKNIAKQTVSKLRELGVKDQAVLNNIEAYLENTLDEPEMYSAVDRVWPSPQTWLAGILGATLSGALTPEELVEGTTAGVVASHIVEVAWTKIQNVFSEEELPANPPLKKDSNSNVADIKHIDTIIQDITKESIHWRSQLSESERRMDETALRIAQRNLGRPGPLGDLARHLI